MIETAIQPIIDRAIANPADTSHKLNLLNLPRRVRQYLWAQFIDAQNAADRNWYFHGYVLIYRVQNPERNS